MGRKEGRTLSREPQMESNPREKNSPQPGEEGSDKAQKQAP
jgi:hypothetical protein